MAKKLWERQDHDTDKSFDAFVQYLMMPPSERSLRAVAEISGNIAAKQRYIEDWSSRHDWVVRARAWDDYQAQLARDALSKQEINDRLEQRRVRRDLTRVMLAQIQNQVLSRDNETGKITPKVIDPDTLDRLSRSFVRILDQSRQEYDDMPTQRTDNQHTGKDGGPIEYTFNSWRDFIDDSSSE